MSVENDAAKAALNEIKGAEHSKEVVINPDTGTTIPGDASDIEAQAAERGWTPEGVEGKRNLTAEEFLDRQVLYDDIRNLKKSNKKLTDGIEAMRKMQDGIRAREREKTIKELNAQKREALEEQNYDEVMKIDESLREVHSEPIEPQTNIVFDNWVEENQWYHSNTEMRRYADTLGAGYYAENPKIPMEKVYEYVAKEAKLRFPEEFGNANRNRQSAVEGAGQGRTGSAGGGKPTRYKVSDLPPQDRQIMDSILRVTKGMTEADYLKQYFGQ